MSKIQKEKKETNEGRTWKMQWRDRGCQISSKPSNTILLSSKPLGCLKWNGSASAPFFWEIQPLLIFYLSVLVLLISKHTKMDLHFKDPLNQVLVSLLNPKFILHKGQLMSFVASLFDIVVCYGNLQRESIVCITQPSWTFPFRHSLTSFCQLTAMASTTSFLIFL